MHTPTTEPRRSFTSPNRGPNSLTSPHAALTKDNLAFRVTASKPMSIKADRDNSGPIHCLLVSKAARSRLIYSDGRKSTRHEARSFNIHHQLPEPSCLGRDGVMSNGNTGDPRLRPGRNAL